MRDTPCELHQCKCATLIVDKSHVIYRRQQVFDRKMTTRIAVKKLWAPPQKISGYVPDEMKITPTPARMPLHARWTWKTTLSSSETHLLSSRFRISERILAPSRPFWYAFFCSLSRRKIFDWHPILFVVSSCRYVGSLHRCEMTELIWPEERDALNDFYSNENTTSHVCMRVEEANKCFGRSDSMSQPTINREMRVSR